MLSLSDKTTKALGRAVQRNCAISDARHARDYSLCIYLLRMREYYRWKHDLPLLQKMHIEQVGNWVTEQESWWDQIEHEEYQPLTLDGVDFNPFDHDLVNQSLLKHGLVYSAGVGRMGQPHFALSTLLCHRVDQNIQCFDCGEELARDTVTVPAMARGEQIFVRHASIRRFLWELYDDWCLHRNPGPMAEVVQHFDLRSDFSLESALSTASTDIAPLFESHERGEVAASALLGDAYSELTLSMAGTRDEHYLRAVRDLLADTLRTWPLIVKLQSIHYLDFWLAGLSGLRLNMLERSGVHESLAEGPADERLRNLQEITSDEQQRWQRLCSGLLVAYQHQPNAKRNKIDAETILSSLW